MKKLLLLLILNAAFGILNCGAQNNQFHWANTMGGTNDDYQSAIAIDANENVYMVGGFMSTVDFDPGPNTFNLTATSGNNDIYVAKYDAYGSFVWAIKLGGSGNDMGYSIDVDTIGNFYITGLFEGTVDFDPGSGTVSYTDLNSNYPGDIFVCKYDTDANLLWAKRMGGVFQDWGLDISVDCSGNVLTTGRFRNTVDFDPGLSTYNLVAGGQNACFVSKLDSLGNFVWANRFTAYGTTVTGNSITLDEHNNVYTTGFFVGSDSVDFDPGAGTFWLEPEGTINSDIFISKLDSLGNFEWAKKLGSQSSDKGYGIVVEPVTGNVYSTGEYYSSPSNDFDPGSGTYQITGPTGTSGDAIYISKLDSSGNFVWAKGVGGSCGEGGRDIKLDIEGKVYVTGEFGCTVDFDPGPGTYTLTNNSTQLRRNAFILKLDSAGSFVWADQIFADATTFNQSYGFSIEVSPSENIYVSGYYNRTADFDPGSGTYNLSSINNTNDLFLLKLGVSIPIGLDNNDVNNSFVLYPNPATNTVTIETATAQGIYQLQDITGKQLLSGTITANKFSLDISTLSKGIYLLSIIDGEQQVNRKVVKE